MRHPLKRQLLALLGFVVLAHATGGVLTNAASAEQGDVTRIGGQGRDAACREDQKVITPPGGGESRIEGFLGDEGRDEPLASVRFNYHTFGNVRSIAVDAGGQQVFVPSKGVVRGSSGIVAGAPSTVAAPLSGQAAEGAHPKQVSLRPVAVAVDSRAENLYILEDDAAGGARVRHASLRSQPTIKTVAGTNVGVPIRRQSTIAADDRGHVYIGEFSAPGAIHRLDVASTALTQVGSLGTGVQSLAVDAGGTALFAVGAGGTSVLKIDLLTNAMTTVAGSGGVDKDGAPATTVALSDPVHVAVDPLGKHLYISDGGHYRIRKVDLSTSIIETIIGTGNPGYQDGGKADAMTLNRPSALDVDLFGNVFILSVEDCAILMAEQPVPIFQAPPSTTPAPTPPTTTPSGTTGEDATEGGGDPSPAPTNGETGTVGQPEQGAAPNPGGATGQDQTGILSNTQGQNQTQILEHAQSPVGQEPVVQATPQPTPTPSPTPTPTPDASGFAAPVNASAAPTPTPDPGAAAGGAADAGVVAPVSPPAPAPVPPAPDPSPVAGSVAPPPAAQPVSNIGLAGGDGEAARGATRYAMVRSDDDESAVAALSMVLGGVVLAGFLCVMFVAPGASSKPKPRPKGAY